MKPLCQIPSPYGLLIDVFHDPERSTDPDLCYFHNLEDCMTLAGVHGDINRKRCAEEFRRQSAAGSITFELFLKHGGRKASYADLTKPATSIYKTMPRTAGMEVPIENWVTLVMDAPDWYHRSAALLGPVSSCIEEAKTWDTPEPLQGPVVVIGVMHLLTAALEHLHEKEIDCLEAAAFYSLSLHDEWSSAGLNWLEPIRSTWLADWLTARPQFVEFARLCRIVNPDLPAWIAGDRT
ncbi:hypothetical protein DEM27_28595 [Metarhizobium album]|uniref:Uncharacterized protein n=1 Tax=Metarhizobium album TaxID=2182425 RepID=A0A2U2DHH4_9HYPH|nr:hypothetical protein [Rhizobium album]PWE52767.1 hypothetical protein DEM27_28595 [Rhizobium album]